MKIFYHGLIALFFSVLCCAITVSADDIQTVYQLDELDASPAIKEGSPFIEIDELSVDAPSVVLRVPNEPDLPVSGVNAYQLDAGDKIKIHVFGQPDMDVEDRLGASGDIRFPFLGKIHVTGMTLPELERKITHDLSDGYLIDPQVRVSIEEFRPFYVNGEVRRPGAYPYQPGLSVRKAISLAGGFTIDADKNKVFLIHSNDSEKNEEKAVLKQKMWPGDILTIKKSFFFVNGEVKNPGKYPYQADLTYRMAIAMAGGLKEKSDDDKVYVVHEGKDHQTYHVDNLDAEIKPGDVITTKEGFF